MERATHEERGRHRTTTAQGGAPALHRRAGAAVTPLTGLIGHDRLLPLAAAMAAFFAAALVLLAATRDTAR